MSAGRNLTGSDEQQQQQQSKSDNSIGGSLVNLVAASPSPEPAPAAARSASSGAHRLPPINGSIFGKRSLNGNQHTSQPAGEHNKQAKSNHGQQHNETPSLGRSQISSGLISDGDNPVQQPKSRPPPRPQPAQTTTSPSSSIHSTSEATNYKDIITETIENFLSLNNENDPEEASVAFCRMIVYECKQLLSARGRARRGMKKSGQRNS